MNNMHDEADNKPRQELPTSADAQSLEVVIGGDLVPVGKGVAFFVAGDAKTLVGDELLGIIHGADVSVFNLETPLADAESPIAKCGPNLMAPTTAAKGLLTINPGAFGLANNHVMDQGVQGLRSTIEAIGRDGSRHVGAGADLDEAKKPFVFKKNGITVGFYACAEREFSIAGESSPGANPFDPLESLDHVTALKAKCDYVIVLYHGGKEHYRYPSPQLRRICRKIAEKGADLIVCQHSHCVGCREEWADAEIVYGQGNFLFDYSDSEFWQTSLLLRVVATGEGMHVEYVPLRKQGVGVRLAQDDDARDILSGFEARSSQILQEGFVEAEYKRYASETLAGYLRAFIPRPFRLPYRIINKLSRGKLQKGLANKRCSKAQINYIECEAHRELFLEGLKGL